MTTYLTLEDMWNILEEEKTVFFTVQTEEHEIGVWRNHFVGDVFTFTISHIDGISPEIARPDIYPEDPCHMQGNTFYFSDWDIKKVKIPEISRGILMTVKNKHPGIYWIR